MPIRFLLFWFVVSTIAYGVVFIMTRRERRAASKTWRRIAISAAIGLLVVIPLFSLNNISGA